MFRKKPPVEKSIGRWWNVCSRRGFVARREYEINRDDVLTTVRRSVYLTDHHAIFFFSKRNRLNCGVSIIILVSRLSSSLINSKTKQACIEHGISTKNRITSTIHQHEIRKCFWFNVNMRHSGLTIKSTLGRHYIPRSNEPGLLTHRGCVT